MRFPIWGFTKDQNGRVILGATVSVYLTGTSTPADIYAAVTGGSPVNSVLSSSITGSFIFFVDTADYTSQAFRIVVSKAPYESITIDNIYSPMNYLFSPSPQGIDLLRVYGNGTDYTDATILAALADIGTSTPAAIFLRDGTWSILASRDWSAYRNIVFNVSPGAILSHGAFTLNIPNVIAPPYQWLSGTGLITFSAGMAEIKPDWYGVTGTNDEVPIQKALNSAFVSRGIPVKPDAKSYSISAKITVPDGVTLKGVAAGWETTMGTVFSVSGGITAIESINGSGPSYIEGLTLTGGASGAIGIHVASHRTHLDKINIVDFTGDDGIAVDNTGSSSGPDCSTASNIFVLANSAGFPITTNPLKRAILFGSGTLGFKLEKFVFWYTGVDGYGIATCNGAGSVTMEDGDITGGWISDTTDVMGIKVSDCANVTIRDVRFEKNNHAIKLTGASLGNFNTTIDSVMIDGSYPGSGTSHWSKSGITMDVWSNTVSIRDSRIANVYGSNTDIVGADLVTNLEISNVLSDDGVGGAAINIHAGLNAVSTVLVSDMVVHQLEITDPAPNNGSFLLSTTFTLPNTRLVFMVTTFRWLADNNATTVGDRVAQFHIDGTDVGVLMCTDSGNNNLWQFSNGGSYVTSLAAGSHTISVHFAGCCGIYGHDYTVGANSRLDIIW